MKTPRIQPIDIRSGEAAQKRLDNLIKPKGSLGRLEEIVVRLCSIQETVTPDVSRKRVCVFAGDHGVVEENVSAYPQNVTREMVRGFLRDQAAICVLARSCAIELLVIDAGLSETLELPGLIPLRAGSGTRNFVQEPAMTEKQMEKAMTAGSDLAMEAAGAGVKLLAGGDMGIGNTTSASAIYAALFGVDPSEVTGYGAGLTEQGRTHKIHVIRRALERWNSAEPLDVLRQFGGFEIAALAGFYLGAASARVAVVIDGFICGAAAAIALSLSRNAGEYFFFAHRSAESGTAAVLNALGVKPLLDLDLRLGEGTGAALAMQIIDNAVRLYREMPTFEEAEVTRNLS